MIIAMEGKSCVKSPEEIEEGIKSTETVTWNPFTVFPKEIYLEIFEKVDDSVDKQNFMNAHTRWYDLFKSKRVLFLPQQVFKAVRVGKEEPWMLGGQSDDEEEIEVDVEEEVEVDVEEEVEVDDDDDEELEIDGDKCQNLLTYKDLHKYRLVCRDWDKGIQNYFQLHDNRFKLDGGMQIWNWRLRGQHFKDSKVSKVPCKSFRWHKTRVAEKDLERFSITHPPSKNPLLSRSVILSPFFINRAEGQPEGHAQAQGLPRAARIMASPASPAFMPQLNSPFLIRHRASIDALLERYGQHIWHCKFTIGLKLLRETLIVIANWLTLMPELKTLEFEYDEGVCLSVPFTQKELKAFQFMKVTKPELKKLLLLKSLNLPSVVFNKLFRDLPELNKIQIRTYKGEGSCLKNFKLPTDRKNLREAFFTLKGKSDFEYLSKSKPFPNLKSLAMTLEFEADNEYYAGQYMEWPEWKLIWNILEEKFPALENLTLRLPKASEDDKEEALHQSLESKLDLKNLKKLWVAIPNLCSLDFLLPCKVLEELEIVLKQVLWDSDESRELGKIGKVNFNGFFQTMWESNVWVEFPKLKKLEIKCLGQGKGISGTFYLYEKKGDEKSYKIGSF